MGYYFSSEVIPRYYLEVYKNNSSILFPNNFLGTFAFYAQNNEKHNKHINALNSPEFVRAISHKDVSVGAWAACWCILLSGRFKPNNAIPKSTFGWWVDLSL